MPNGRHALAVPLCPAVRHPDPMRALSLLLGLTAATSCTCGGVVVTDPFEPHTGAAADLPESLHVYASGASVPLRVHALGGRDVSSVRVEVEGGSIDPENQPVAKDGLLSFVLLTGDPGTIALQFVDADGALIDERSLTVVAAARMELDVASAAIEGVPLPDVDLAGARIALGGKAAFRTTLFDGDDAEVYGTRAVEGTPPDVVATTRKTAACAPETCEALRSAIEISLPPDGGPDPFDVALAAGDAEEVLRIVPTDPTVVDTFTMDAQAEDDAEDGDRRAVYARVEIAGEPVFGAPVTWSLDDASVEGAGDLVVFNVRPGATKTLAASLGDKSASVEVETGDAEDITITSITAACAQTTPDTAATGAATVLALAAVRRRRRGEPSRRG